MKHLAFFVAVFFVAVISVVAQPGSTGINTPSPSSKAALHINSSPGVSQGLLIPRLTTAERPAFDPLTNTESGLMFYDTDKDSIFYWTGIKWVSLMINTTVSPSNYWNLSGNDPDSLIQYLGTNTAKPLIFRTNNIERIRIGRAGNIGINMNPAGNTLLSLKSTGAGKVMQIQKSSGSGNLLEIAENASIGELRLFDAAGTANIVLNAANDSYFLGGNLGVGVNPATGARLEVRGINSIGSNLALRLTNSTGTALFYVTNAGEVVIPTFAPTVGIVTTSNIGQLTVTAGTPVTGSGAINKVAFWNSASSLSSNVNFHWNNTNSYLGIGTAVPNAPLQFSNAIANRKIVLYETANNDQQYYGFGINGGTLRYQTDALTSDHIFFAAASTSASNELMRIKGNGKASIGITPYSTVPQLHVYGASVAGMVEVLRLTGGVCSVGTSGPLLNFQNGCSSSTPTNYQDWIGASIGSPYSGSYSGDLAFYTNDGTVTTGPITSLERMKITRLGYVGIGVTAPLSRLAVAGNTGQVVNIGNIFSGNYAGINLNGTIGDGNYNLISSSADPSLYINRPTGASIIFRENNDGNNAVLTLNPTGDNTSRNGHVSLTSSNTWGTSVNIANSNSGGSTYSIVSTGSSHPLGAGSFVIQDGFNSNYAFVLNSLNGDTHIGATTSSASAVGIGYGNPATDLAGTQKLQVNGTVCSTGFQICSDERYKSNIVTIGNVLPKVRQMRGVFYDWRIKDFPNNNFDDRKQIGVIAQEIEEYYPELVETDNKGYKTVDYSKLTPVLLQAIKEMDTLITQQDKKILELKTENEIFKKDLDKVLHYLKLNERSDSDSLLSRVKE